MIKSKLKFIFLALPLLLLCQERSMASTVEKQKCLTADYLQAELRSESKKSIINMRKNKFRVSDICPQVQGLDRLILSLILVDATFHYDMNGRPITKENGSTVEINKEKLLGLNLRRKKLSEAQAIHASIEWGLEQISIEQYAILDWYMCQQFYNSVGLRCSDEMDYYFKKANEVYPRDRKIFVTEAINFLIAENKYVLKDNKNSKLLLPSKK